MYNFLDPILLPKVTTKCPATDRYEVENLISSNFLIKSRGFIAYTTMKPPIDIDFQLICNASLSHILISSKIGSHKSSGIEVFVKNPTDSQFVSISKAFYEENGVVFYNSRYYSKNKFATIGKDYHTSYFRSNEFRSFINTDTIRIRILKSNGTIPCLARLEIWGNISRSCSHETTRTIHRLMNRSKSLCVNVPENATIRTDSKPFEIPDDFKDALTYELMAIPMTLPSGHTIDQSTLEKCLATDASCGRHGSDPFTGLKYIENRKPILNVALKTRIDMYLIKNSNVPEISTVKRTLGKRTDYQTLSSRSSTGPVQNYFDITNVSKKIKLTYDSRNNNLDDALKEALNSEGFVRFTDESRLGNEIRNVSKCVICDQGENLYKLPCGHLYCRNCSLTIKNESRCKDCNIEFFRNDIRRYHC